MSTEHDPGMIDRREFLRGSAGVAAGMLLPTAAGRALAAAAPAAAKAATAKARAVIQIWLWGGPSQLETFDPKPEAGADYCGPLDKPIATNVDGIRICQLLPRLAQLADKYSIIRSMTHGVNGHETAAYIVQTGRRPGGKDVYPSAGAVVSLFKGYSAGYKGLLPPYVVLTRPQGRFSEAGFLGPRFKPFATGGDPAARQFVVEGFTAAGISKKRQKSRRDLLRNLDGMREALKGDPRMVEMLASEEKAYELILGEASNIFYLDTEKDEVRQQYGMNTFGQSCLVARRLVEHGVPYVTINSGGWDTHKQHFEAMRRKLPQLDNGVATLIQDLSDHGLLDSTIVWVGGEFGRRPKIDRDPPWAGGRGHWGPVFSTLIAGGGFKGGQVVGASDARGERVKDRPVYPWDLIAAVYRQLGIDPDGELPHSRGTPVRVTPSAKEGYKTGGRLKELV